MAISFAEIKQRYEQERRAQQRPTTVNDLPFTYDAITPEWLTTFLRYRQQMLAALAWWTGTLGQPPDAPAMQPAETSLEFIKRMAVALDDLDCLESV